MPGCGESSPPHQPGNLQASLPLQAPTESLPALRRCTPLASFLPQRYDAWRLVGGRLGGDLALRTSNMVTVDESASVQFSRNLRECGDFTSAGTPNQAGRKTEKCRARLVHLQLLAVSQRPHWPQAHCGSIPSNNCREEGSDFGTFLAQFSLGPQGDEGGQDATLMQVAKRPGRWRGRGQWGAARWPACLLTSMILAGVKPVGFEAAINKPADASGEKTYSTDLKGPEIRATIALVSPASPPARHSPACGPASFEMPAIDLTLLRPLPALPRPWMGWCCSRSLDRSLYLFLPAAETTAPRKAWRAICSWRRITHSKRVC